MPIYILNPLCFSHYPHHLFQKRDVMVATNRPRMGARPAVIVVSFRFPKQPVLPRTGYCFISPPIGRAWEPSLLGSRKIAAGAPTLQRELGKRNYGLPANQPGEPGSSPCSDCGAFRPRMGARPALVSALTAAGAPTHRR